MHSQVGGISDEKRGEARRGMLGGTRNVLFPQELIELTVVICHFNLMNRLNDTLQLELETPPPGMRSTKVPPEKLSRYARDVLAGDI